MNFNPALFTVIFLFFVLMLFAVPYHSAQRDRMKRNKEILDRYNPQHSKKPLGL